MISVNNECLLLVVLVIDDIIINMMSLNVMIQIAKTCYNYTLLLYIYIIHHH